MKIYIKPEIEIYKFDVKSSLMTQEEETVSEATIYIDQTIENQAWTTYSDGQDWNWENVGE